METRESPMDGILCGCCRPIRFLLRANRERKGEQSECLERGRGPERLSQVAQTTPDIPLFVFPKTARYISVPLYTPNEEEQKVQPSKTSDIR